MNKCDTRKELLRQKTNLKKISAIDEREENFKLKISINEALDILYSYGETLNPNFQKEMLEVLIKVGE